MLNPYRLHGPMFHILTKSLQVRYYDVHLGMRETDAQRGKANLLRVTQLAQGRFRR